MYDVLLVFHRGVEQGPILHLRGGVRTLRVGPPQAPRGFLFGHVFARGLVVKVEIFQHLLLGAPTPLLLQGTLQLRAGPCNQDDRLDVLTVPQPVVEQLEFGMPVVVATQAVLELTRETAIVLDKPIECHPLCAVRPVSSPYVCLSRSLDRG